MTLFHDVMNVDTCLTTSDALPWWWAGPR